MFLTVAHSQHKYQIKELRYKSKDLFPDVVIGILHWHNPSGRTMALVSTQPLTERSIEIFPVW
jgi:hypothetical protein